MREYKPISPFFATLEPGETPKYSFVLAGVKPGWLGRQVYLLDHAYYVGHLTDRRLVIEPLQFPDWVVNLASITSGLISNQSDSPMLKGMIKEMNKKAKDSCERSKFLSDAQLYWSIPYSEIISFELQECDEWWITSSKCTRVVTSNSDDRDSFVFAASEATDSALKGLGNPSELADAMLRGLRIKDGKSSTFVFRDFGNDLIAEEKKFKRIEEERKAQEEFKRIEEERKAIENRKIQKEARFKERVETKTQSLPYFDLDSGKERSNLKRVGKGIVLVLLDCIVFVFFTVTIPLEADTLNLWQIIYSLISFLVIPAYAFYLIVSGILRGIWSLLHSPQKKHEILELISTLLQPFG